MSLFSRREKKEEIVIDMLANALDRHNLSEIEYGRYGIKLRLSKQSAPSSFVSKNTQDTRVSVAASSEPSTPETVAKKSDAVDTAKAITSPMVGVIYLSPNPSQPTYVKKGDKVKTGDTLCLVEAMKTFNPVKADKAGVVSEILVKESQSVEYGEPLFIIE